MRERFVFVIQYVNNKLSNAFSNGDRIPVRAEYHHYESDRW